MPHKNLEKRRLYARDLSRKLRLLKAEKRWSNRERRLSESVSKMERRNVIEDQEMRRWEYEIFNLPSLSGDGIPKFREQANKLGQDGWEIVHCTLAIIDPLEYISAVVVKREIPDGTRTT